MNPESIDTYAETNASPRSEPLDGIKAYLKLSGWLTLSAIGFLSLHYLAMAHFGITPADEGIWSLAAHIPREISVALLITAVLNCIVERNTQLRHWHLESSVQEKLRKNAEDMDNQARKNADRLNEEARQRAERLNEDVRKNVLRAVFLENLGPNVVHQIESKLFERRPYRVEANVTYSLTLGRDARGVTRMLIDSHIRYKVLNPSSIPEIIPITFATTSPDEFADDCRITGISCDGTDILNPTIVAKCQRAGTIEYVDKDGYPLGPRKSKWVEIRHRRADYVEGNENYVTTLPVEELRLYVTHPPGFHVWATSMHPDEAELFSDTSISKGWALWGLIPTEGQDA
jgi:hypothetical protein